MVTVAIPFYNAEKYLIEAIKSVFAQTYKEWELILIDDGSTDNSLAIAQSINDTRVRVFSDGHNRKLACRLNEITRLAKYDFIARMDADDLMVPNRLEVQMKYFEIDSDLDIITSGVYSVLNDLKLIGVRGQSFEKPDYSDILSRKFGIVHAALIARKSWYQRNLYDENLSVAQDLDLWIRSSKRSDLKIRSLSAPLYIYREENNITRDKLLRAYRNERFMIRKYENSYFNILFFKSLFKSGIVHILHLFGKISVLQKRRGRIEISTEQLSSYHSALRSIQNIELPIRV
jgi:glycosyltransferase involved in cell wall biosynthesis